MAQMHDNLTLAEQIGQLFMVGFHGTEPTPEIIEMIQRYHVGGIILFTRNIRDAAQVRRLTHDLQQIAREARQRYPLLIATDQENGLVRRFGQDFTTLPGNMALGATGSAPLVEEVTAATGAELRALGVNMNLAPDADVNNNPANPVIGVRSFGEDPARVAEYVAAAVRGYQESGVIATIKHFPGHGDTATDSHKALPTIPYDLDRLEAVELLPFRAGIAAGAPCVMTAHIHLPQLMPATLPATVAPQIIQGLLRERLGYTGVVMTDCLEMNGVAETVGVEPGAALAVAAGNDVVLISHRIDRQRAGIAAVHAAVERGQIAPTLLVAALGRVLDLKARYLAWDDIPDAAVTWHAPTEHRALRDRAYAQIITLVKDDAGMIPLKLAPEQRLLVVAQSTAETSQAVDIYYSNAVFVAALQQQHALTAGITVAPTPTAEELSALHKAASNADAIIVVTINAYHDAAQIALMRDMLARGMPVIGVAMGNPYDLAAFPDLPTYLATYEYTEPALRATAQALFGAITPVGKLPVSMPG